MSGASMPSSVTQLPLSEDARSRYSETELQDYFKRLGLPQKYLDSPVLSDKSQALTTEHGLPFLQALTRHHTCSVPFENLELHYSAHKTITLDAAALYDKIVRQRRGGRCMENNTFFATMLRSLGYEVRNCGGRVARAMSPYPEVRRNQATTYDGWNHMLNLVRLGTEWYVVDVGMGSMGPNMPYPLRDGFETMSIAPRKIRIQSRAIAESYGTNSNKLWCYDVCYDPVSGTEEVWVPVYCFTETEFLPQDYEVMSWYTSTHKTSFFTKYVTSMKMVMDEAQEKIVGNVTLFGGDVKETIGSEKRGVRECKTEDERVDVLREVFGIDLTEEQRKGISEDSRLG
jgi:arylamine N-acetyltransferase